MKQQLRIGSNPIVLSGTSFGRAYLLVQGVGAAAITNTDFNLNYLRTQIEIAQAGIKDSTAFNAVGPVTRAINELPYTMGPSDGPVNFAPNWNVASNGQTLAGAYTEPATRSTSVFFIPLLEGGYSLKGDDYIRFNIDVLPTFFSANVTSGSSVYLVTEEANGIVQTDVNIPVYEPITTDKQSPAFSYDAVSVCQFLNAVEAGAGPSAWSYTTDPLQAVDFRSQFVTEQFDIQTLYAKNLVGNSNPSVNSHTIYSVEPSALWDAYIGLAINTTNVTIGSQFLYVSKVLTGSSLLNRAVAHEEKIIKTNLKMRGVVAPRKKY